MGIKMSKARLIATNEEVLVNNATEEMRNKKLLKCFNQECPAKLTWVRMIKKNYEIEKKFYRLLNGEKHCESCSYNTLGQVTIIANKANNKIIENINNGKYEFRLNIVYEALSNGGEKKDKHYTVNKDGGLEDKEKIYKSSGVASPYLAVMRDIMKLRSQVYDNRDLENIVKIKHNGRSILWKNFYYELGNEETLYKYVEKNGYIYNCKPKRLNYPICFEGIIDKEIKSNKDGNYFINFKLANYIEPDEYGNVNLYKCVIITKKSEIVDYINRLILENKKIKIVSYFIPSIKLTESSAYRNYIVSGWINNIEQIYIESI